MLAPCGTAAVTCPVLLACLLWAGMVADEYIREERLCRVFRQEISEALVIATHLQACSEFPLTEVYI